MKEDSFQTENELIGLNNSSRSSLRKGKPWDCKKLLNKKCLWMNELACTLLSKSQPWKLFKIQRSVTKDIRQNTGSWMSQEDK